MANGEWRVGKIEVGQPINSYRDLTIWQDAVSLAEQVYTLTGGFPREELFGMTAQLRRSTVSIAANIAEGHGREQTQIFIQFLRIAQGSLKEVETHVIICQRVRLIETAIADDLLGQCASLGKRIRSLVISLNSKT